MFNFLFISWTISIVGLKSWKPCIYSAKSEKAEIVTFLNITPHIIYEKKTTQFGDVVVILILWVF